jgi:cobalamin-dependent methionine synthase I
MIIIAEKINGTRKSVNKAVLEKDVKFIENLALSQVEAGATYLDVNAGTPTDREPDDMIWLVETVQNVTDCPLCLDSPNGKALLAGLKVCKKEPMINSISGEPDRLESVLPVVADNKLKVLALAIDCSIIQPTVEGRMKIVRNLFDITSKAGLPDEYVFIDPLIMSAATTGDAAAVSLEIMRTILKEHPTAHLTGGMSNISFGLPARSLLNRAFMTLAMDAGLDSAIMDPTDRALMECIYATDAVLGKDKFCNKYNRAYRNGKIGVKPAEKPTGKPAC